MTNIYRLKLFTRKEKDDLIYRKHCIDNKIMAIGWGDCNCEDGTVDEYVKKANDMYNDSSSFKTGLNYILNEIKKDDYVWTQIDGLKYYLGKISEDEVHLDSIQPGVGLTKKCEWKLIENFDDIPGQVISNFVGRGITLCKMRFNEDLKQYCDWLYHGKSDSDKPKMKNCFSLFHSDDLEDLVGLYLQKEGYYIIPSTNKKGQKLIEYELINDEGEKACVQCKIGNSKVTDEKVKEIQEKFKGFKIYVSTFAENIITDNSVNFISKEILLDFAKKNKNILSQRIKNYLSFEICK